MIFPSHTILFSVYEFFNTEHTILSNFFLLILYKILSKIALLLLTQNINQNSNYIDMVYIIFVGKCILKYECIM